MCKSHNKIIQIQNEAEGRYILKLIKEHNLGTPRSQFKECNIKLYAREAEEGEDYYWYQGPMDKANRYFCHQMLVLDKVFQKYEINYLSRKLGYDVFAYRGSFGCRHSWQEVRGNVITTPPPTMKQLQGLTKEGQPYNNPSVKNPKTYTNYPTPNE